MLGGFAVVSKLDFQFLPLPQCAYHKILEILYVSLTSYDGTSKFHLNPPKKYNLAFL